MLKWISSLAGSVEEPEVEVKVAVSSQEVSKAQASHGKGTCPSFREGHAVFFMVHFPRAYFGF